MENKLEMEKESIYLMNLISSHLEVAETFMEEVANENAAHRLRIAIYHINSLIEILDNSKKVSDDGVG